MKIKTLKSFLLEGKHIKPGEVIDVQSGFTARELIRYGKAFAVAESTVIAKPEAAVAPEEAEKAPEAVRKAGRPRKVKTETETE
jgi:hypothetical protein